MIHCSCLLLQQYMVDACTKIEGNDLAFHRANQQHLRPEEYRGLMDHLERRADENDQNMGNIFILPSTIPGGEHWMY